MKHTIAALAVMAMVGGAAFAGPTCGGCAGGGGTAAKATATAALVCPVTGEKIASAEKAVAKSTYQGKTVYFCCAGCKAKFDKDPAKYVKK